MADFIEISCNLTDVRVRARVEDDIPEELRTTFLNAVRKPLKMAADHTMSSGDYFLARGRPPRHPVKLGNQIHPNPMGGIPVMLSRLRSGDVLYTGGNDMSFGYGPHNTEALEAKGVIVAKVPAESLDDYWKLGRAVWEAAYRTHVLPIVTVEHIKG